MAGAPGQSEPKLRHRWAQRWLSPSRLAPYLNACDGDIDGALELHE